jgi:hypothetical protein
VSFEQVMASWICALGSAMDHEPNGAGLTLVSTTNVRALSLSDWWVLQTWKIRFVDHLIIL